MNIVLIFILIVLIFGIFVILKYSFVNRRKLNKKSILSKKDKILKSRVSYKEKLIDLDKLYHFILKKLGYKGTFGDILKKKPKEIYNIDKIWELHKLRNKLVHDFDLISESSLRKKVGEYSLEIERLLK